MDLVELSKKLEIISCGYAAKNGFERNSDWFLMKMQEELGELTQAHLKSSLRARSNGLSATELKTAVEEETADLLCHVLLYAMHHDVDLGAAVTKKWLSWLQSGE